MPRCWRRIVTALLVGGLQNGRFLTHASSLPAHVDRRRLHTRRTSHIHADVEGTIMQRTAGIILVGSLILALPFAASAQRGGRGGEPLPTPPPNPRLESLKKDV